MHGLSGMSVRVFEHVLDKLFRFTWCCLDFGCMVLHAQCRLSKLELFGVVCFICCASGVVVAGKCNGGVVINSVVAYVV